MRERLMIMAFVLIAVVLAFILGYSAGYNRAEIQGRIDCVPYPDLILMEDIIYE